MFLLFFQGLSVFSFSLGMVAAVDLVAEITVSFITAATPTLVEVEAIEEAVMIIILALVVVVIHSSMVVVVPRRSIPTNSNSKPNSAVLHRCSKVVTQAKTGSIESE